LRIAIEDVRVLVEGPEFVVAGYREVQTRADGGGDARVATVVFGREEAAPHGLVWRHLHETWVERG
jgi:hypothetical protein